jgi:hypothetical protein
MVGHPSSPSRVRFAALQNARALDRSGRLTRALWLSAKGFKSLNPAESKGKGDLKIEG